MAHIYREVGPSSEADDGQLGHACFIRLIHGAKPHFFLNIPLGHIRVLDRGREGWSTDSL